MGDASALNLAVIGLLIGGAISAVVGLLASHKLPRWRQLALLAMAIAMGGAAGVWPFIQRFPLIAEAAGVLIRSGTFVPPLTVLVVALMNGRGRRSSPPVPAGPVVDSIGEQTKMANHAQRMLEVSREVLAALPDKRSYTYAYQERSKLDEAIDDGLRIRLRESCELAMLYSQRSALSGHSSRKIEIVRAAANELRMTARRVFARAGIDPEQADPTRR